MDKCREAFEKAFPVPAHWIEFNEKSNEYYCPYVADAKAFEYQSKWVVWQHQQKRIDEINQENEKLRLDHAAYKKGMKNIIREKLKQVEGRDFTIAAMERSLVLANAKVVELQAQVGAALQEIKGAARWIDEDAINDPEFIKGGALRALKRLEQALEGGESK